jgi:putative CocE/NonD family hydrolase
MKQNRIDCGEGVTLERSVPCRLSDGTTLISDHYYPPKPGPAPTLLMRQPYGRDIASTVVYAHPAWFARKGYNVVIQDVRGRGGSEGTFYPFRHEAADGAETIAWLRTRPETNGRIGMYGFSYQGATQLLAASRRPPGLDCIAPAMTAADLYNGWFYHHGALRLASSLGWGLQMLKEDARRLNLGVPSQDLRAASNKLEAAWSNLAAQPHHKPYADHPALTDPSLPSYVRDWFAHDTPSTFWSDLDISAVANEIAIPALHLSGWFDTYLEGSIAGFELLRSQASMPFARDHQYLLAGPWVHIPWGDRVGDLALGPEALLDTNDLLLRWFDHWLRDTKSFANEPRVRHFALGLNQWLAADTITGPTTQTLHLHSFGNANSRKGNGFLDATPPRYESPDLFSYDPEVPVLSTPPATDQSTLELGNNLLVYTAEPLTAALHIFGRPRVLLYAATSATHADLTAKLVRLTPHGRAESVCIGIARSTHLFDAYKEDTVHAWEFTLEPTSIVFAPGDSIRLEIAASAFPLYDRNPSNATPPSQMSQFNWQRSTHMIFHDINRPSTLTLPTLETQP